MGPPFRRFERSSHTSLCLRKQELGPFQVKFSCFHEYLGPQNKFSFRNSVSNDPGKFPEGNFDEVFFPSLHMAAKTGLGLYNSHSRFQNLVVLSRNQPLIMRMYAVRVYKGEPSFAHPKSCVSLLR